MNIDFEATEFPSLSFDDFVWFLSSHTRVLPCESCGTDKWTISTADGVTVNMVLSPYTTQPNMSLMTAPVMCSSCGNVRFFTYQMIESALRERAEK